LSKTVYEKKMLLFIILVKLVYEYLLIKTYELIQEKC